MMEQTIVAETLAPVRLDVFLSETLEDWTRSQIKRQIDEGGASLNGKIAKAGALVKNGAVIKISFSRRFGLEDVEPEDIPIEIIYEDDDIAVINKHQGMVVHPAPGNYTGTLVNALLFHFNSVSNMNSTRPGIVHRIDKETSGLLVVAKNDVAHANLAEQFSKHTARRTYVALLEGVVKEDEGTIHTFLSRDEHDRKKYAVSSAGKEAVTHFKVLERFEGYTLCQFSLETGRTHQIRVHSKFMGHPIVGDKVYGFIKQKFKLDGQLLHAGKLELTHPTTKERMTFEANLPPYFVSVLKKLKKYQK